MKKGEMLIYPTESSYAIGCRYNDKATIKKIMELKGRTDDRFTLVAASLQQVKKYFPFSEEQEQLARKYWPGALSIVVSDQFAVRVPDKSLTRDVAEHAGVPVLATSLNVSGEAPLYMLDAVPPQFKDVPMINIGILPMHPPSTIVECTPTGLVIHRQGAVRVQKLN